MRRLAAMLLAIGLLAGACSMPNFSPPKLGAVMRAIAMVAPAR